MHPMLVVWIVFSVLHILLAWFCVKLGYSGPRTIGEYAIVGGMMFVPVVQVFSLIVIAGGLIIDSKIWELTPRELWAKLKGKQ
ncbi:hypothetical protein FDI24_gp156 [Acidovorax phage ACP17]|uniref:Uncharacterized protein n=1 Tax=Acidovorax phage ACP17 TaxID=2010329 RepID=A0A218M316_9CAUD|nr:hypothetical protein FDI24_gp156 [Acidovorax phage ACP17]ASD50438.1 hypothetical protein [Acidovorax phage ACP17]